MADRSPVRQPVEAEVDTEFEDDLLEEQQLPHEVEEDLESDATGSAAGAADYVLPEENRDVWRNFGYENEAGRALRKLYGGIGQKGGAARVSYPKLNSCTRRWEPQAAAQKPCPQRAHVSVPKSVRPRIDRDDPKYWSYMHPVPGRKPEAEIRAEMKAEQPEQPRLKPGRDQAAEKHSLQDKFRYAGGNAMPSGAMGNVAKGEVPDPAVCRKVLPERWDHVDETGLTKEQRNIFTDLTTTIQDKQARLDEIDIQDAAEQGAKQSKAKTQRNREALQLQNDIQGCVRDIDKLLEMTE